MFGIGPIELSALAVVLISAIAIHFLAKERERINAFNQKAKSFSEVLNIAKTRLESEEGLKHPQVIFRETFDTHCLAKNNFINSLKGTDRDNFKKDWEEYEKYKETINGDAFDQVFSVDDEYPENFKEKRDELLRLINNLLDYAKPK